MLSIGEFSRICFVTKKTLRHYDEIGLLRPEHTADNGYRYYTVAQLRTMLLISRLKTYGFALPEIAEVLADPGGEHLAAKIEEKREQMRLQVQSTQRVLDQMEQDIGKLQRRMDIMENNIVVKTVELAPERIYGVRRMMSVRDFPSVFAQLYTELATKKLHPAGPPMAFYHDDSVDQEFNHDSADIEVAAPVAVQADGTRETPGGLHCFATILGPYRDEAFSAAYAALIEWVEANGYRIGGAPFEKYVRGGEGVKPEEFVTEIYFPIAK